jgi:hypothetical protein
MNAITPPASAAPEAELLSSGAAPVSDPDAILAELVARAKVLPTGSIGAVDAWSADVIAAKMPSYVHAGLAKAAAGATGFDKDDIEKKLRKAAAKLEAAEDDAPDQPPPRTQTELEAACARILNAPDVLRELKADVPALGLAGSGTIALNAFVMAQSRRRDKPMHMAAAGPSGTGKSFEVDAALRLIDPAAIYNIGDGSEKFMQYDTAPLTGRVVYIAEATPLQRDGNSPLAYAIRTLMSEGLFRYRFVDFEKKDANGKPVAQEIVRHGPSAVMITSTAEIIHPEIETRLLRFGTDNSTSQTERILTGMAAGLNAPDPTSLIAEWRAYDEWLTRFGGRDVVVPFASAIVLALDAKAKRLGRPLPSRLRRDFRHVLTAVEVIASLNQRHRQRDAECRIIAGSSDWVWTVVLLEPALSRGSGRSLSPSTLTVFNVIAKWSATAVQGAPAAAAGIQPTPILDLPTRRLATEAGVDQATVVRALRALADGGFIAEAPHRLKERAGQYHIVAHPTAQTRADGILPTWAEVAAAMPQPQPQPQSGTP